MRLRRPPLLVHLLPEPEVHPRQRAQLGQFVSVLGLADLHHQGHVVEARRMPSKRHLPVSPLLRFPGWRGGEEKNINQPQSLCRSNLSYFTWALLRMELRVVGPVVKEVTAVGETVQSTYCNLGSKSRSNPQGDFLGIQHSWSESISTIGVPQHVLQALTTNCGLQVLNRT